MSLKKKFTTGVLCTWVGTWPEGMTYIPEAKNGDLFPGETVKLLHFDEGDMGWVVQKPEGGQEYFIRESGLKPVQALE